jgi:hypothetical protein
MLRHEETPMRLYILAIALLTAIGLLATVHLNLSNDAAAQEFVKKKGAEKTFGNKREFYYGLCIERGGTAAGCGTRMHRWNVKNPKGKVIY